METRILLTRMPRLMRDVLTEIIRSQGDMRLVGRADDVRGLPVQIRRSAPDVVVVGLEREEFPGLCRAVLRRFPEVKVLAVEERGRRLSLYELRPTRSPLGEASPGRLLAWIRRAADGRGWCDEVVGGTVALPDAAVAALRRPPRDTEGRVQ